MAREAGDGLAYDYITFPRQFLSYRWFKPLLVLALGGVFMLVMDLFLFVAASVWAGDLSFINSIGTGYDDMDPYTGPGALAELGPVAVLLRYRAASCRPGALRAYGFEERTSAMRAVFMPL